MPEWMDFSAVENLTTIPGKLISGRYRRPCGYRVKRSKGTKDFYLTLTLQGNGQFHNGKDTCECPEKSIALITPGTPHYYGTPANSVWEFYWCHFLPKEEWLSLLQLPEAIKGIRCARFSNERDWERVKAAFSNLVADNEQGDLFAERLAVHGLEEILLLIFKSAAVIKNPMDPRIECAVELITQHYKQPYCVAELAASVNLSPSRFAHLFKRQTGESVMDMLNKIRMREAKKLLETSSLSIAEIAEEAGFNHPFYFSRQFAAFYGKPPALFRKHLWHANSE